MAQAKKKKKFYDVEMPIINKTTQLYSFTQEELVGRRIVYDLTRVLRGKNALLKLEVKEDKEDLTSTPIELVILPNFLKRMVRKGTDYVEDSLTVISKDAEITMKPILVTRRRVSRAVRNALRQNLKLELEKYAKSKSTIAIFEDILKNQLQKIISLALKKIYPLSLCEIRMISVKKKLKEEKETVPKEVKAEETTE